MSVKSPSLRLPPERFPVKQRVKWVTQCWFRSSFSDDKFFFHHGHFVEHGMSLTICHFVFGSDYYHDTKSYTLGITQRNIYQMVISPDSKRLYSIDDQTELWQWDLIENRLCLKTYHYVIYSLACFAGLLAIGDRGGMVTLMDGCTHQTIWESQCAGYILSLIFNDDGTLLFSGASGMKICVISVDNGHRLREIIHELRCVYHLRSHDQWLLAVGHSGRTLVWNHVTGHFKTEIKAQQCGYEMTISMNANHTLIAISTSKCCCIICEWPSLVKLKAVNGSQMKFHPLNPGLFALIVKNQLKLYHLELGMAVATLRGCKCKIKWYDFTPDGTRIITRSEGGGVCCSWAVAQSNELFEDGYDEYSPIESIPFEPKYKDDCVMPMKHDDIPDFLTGD